MWKQEVANRRGIAPHLEEKQWEEVQKKTFQGWINMHLEKRGMRVQNLDKDLADGVKLINLLEILHGGKIEGRYYKNPKSRPYKIDNVNFALSFITDNLGVKLFGCSAEDLVDGNLKIILGMLWRLIQHFQLTDKNSRQVILDWCKKVTAGYPDIRIENFHDSFADGLFFCALVFQADPSLINYPTLDKTDRLSNIRTVFDIAEKNLSIPQLLDPADVVAKHVDERSVLTYVSMWYERFKTISLSSSTSSSAPAATTTSSSSSASSTPRTPASELQELKEENTRLRQELEDARDSLAVAKQAQIRADNSATEALQRATKAEEDLAKAQEAVSSAQTQVAEAEAAARAAETARAQAEANAAAAVVAAHSGGSTGEGAPSGTAEVELAIANATVKLAETKAALAEAEAALASTRKEEEESKVALASAKAQIHELNTEAETARERLTDLEQKVAEAETKLEALFVQVGEAKSKLQEATDAHSAIEAKRHALQAEVDAIHAGEKPASASKQRSADGEDGMVADTLQEKIMAEQQLEEVQERLKEAEERLRSAQSKLDATNQETSDSSDATRAAEGGQADSQALEDAKEEITVLKKKYERAQAKALKSQKKKYTTRIKSRDKELKTLREQTEIDLKAKDDEIDRLKTQLAKAQKALGEASTSDATEVNADVELLKSEYSQILAIAKLLEEEESNTRTQRRARNSESEDEDGEREADE